MIAAPALDRFGRATHHAGRPILWQPFDGFQTRVLRSRAFEEGVGGGKGCGKCLTPGHEALTRTRGWQRVEDVRAGEEVASWRDGVVSWETVSETHALPYDGEIVVNEKKPFFAVTLNHRFLVRPNHKGEGRTASTYRWVTAAQLRPQMVLPAPSTALPWETETYSGDEMELWGWWLAEGSGFTKAGRCRLSQVNYLGRAAIVALVERMGLRHTVCAEEITVAWRPPLASGVDCYDKFIPRALFAERHADRLLAGLLAGDGYRRRSTGSRAWDYSSSSHQLAEGVHELTTRLGYRAYLRQRVVKSERPHWIVSLTRRADWVLSPASQGGLTREHYTGPVYCLTVPATGCFLVRYRGTVHVTGNSDLVPVWMLEDSHHERFKGLVLRRTYDELQEILDRMHRIYNRLPVASRPYWHGMERRWKFPSRAIIRVGYCKDVSSLRVYRGQEWTRIGYDEVGDQPDERVWDGLVAEIRSPDTTLHRAIMGTWNWGLAGHPWLYRRFYVACDKGTRTAWRKFVMDDGAVHHLSRRFHPGTVRDNPVYARDPVYMAQLMSLPERQRKLLLLGDPEAAGGLALNELSPGKHFVHAFDPPSHWNVWGGFDWGFAHKFAYLVFTVDEDGRVYVVDTIWGQGLGDSLIVQRVKERAPVDRIKVTHAGHDCWNEIKAREGSAGPTTASRFAEGGILLTKANISRVQGLNNLRHYLAWKGLGPDGADSEPVLRFMDTPGNRRLFAQLERLVVDPDDPRDVLKVDADADQAADPEDVSGDDGYDGFRYGMMARPFSARPTMGDRYVRAFSKEALAYERESLLRHRSRLTADDPHSPFHTSDMGELAG